jgi:hypothetical protein
MDELLKEIMVYLFKKDISVYNDPESYTGFIAIENFKNNLENLNCGCVCDFSYILTENKIDIYNAEPCGNYKRSCARLIASFVIKEVINFIENEDEMIEKYKNCHPFIEQYFKKD